MVHYSHILLKVLLNCSQTSVNCSRSWWFCSQDKSNAHKKLLDDAEENFRFKEEAKDLVVLTFSALPGWPCVNGVFVGSPSSDFVDTGDAFWKRLFYMAVIFNWGIRGT